MDGYEVTKAHSGSLSAHQGILALVVIHRVIASHTVIHDLFCRSPSLIHSVKPSLLMPSVNRTTLLQMHIPVVGWRTPPSAPHSSVHEFDSATHSPVEERTMPGLQRV